MAQRILVVDDEAAIRDTLRMVLEYEGYEVATVGDGRAALAELDGGPAAAVLLDIKMPGMDGLETLDRIVAREGAPPVLMISGHGDIATAVECTRRGATDFLEKPLQRERVLVSVRNALSGNRLQGRERRAAEAGRAGDRARRRQRADAPPAGRDRAGGADGGHGPDPGRERHGQGARRARAPPRLEGRQRALRPGQLRGDPGGADRVRALRPREGLLHRRRPQADRQVRRGRRRDDLPRRGRRHVGARPGQGPARARGGRGRARGRGEGRARSTCG